jgi:hypothetical protein
MQLEADGDRHGNAGKMVTPQLQSSLYAEENRLTEPRDWLSVLVNLGFAGLRGYAARGEPADLYFEEYS